MSQSYPRSFIRDNAIVIVGHILVYMKGIILMPVIIKTVGVSIYGGFVLLSSVLGLVFGISSLGAGFRARRFLPATVGPEPRRELFYPQFFFGLVSLLVCSVVLTLLDRQMKVYIFKSEISYGVFIVPLYLISYFAYSQGSDYFRYTSRVRHMTAATLLFPYVHIGLILACFYRYHFIDINMLVVSQSLSALLIAAPCFWVVFREIGIKFTFYNAKSLVSDIRLGFPLVLGFVVDVILAGGDRYFIAFYMTVSDVGYYAPGYVLGSLMVLIPKAIGTALPQLMSKAVDGGNENEARRMLDYALKLFLLLAIPFTLGSLILGMPVLTLLANSDVAEAARLVTPVVALGTIFYGLNIILSNILFVRLKTYAMFKMNLFAAVFNLMANFILLYFFRNITVAALTTLLSYALAFVYISRIIHRERWAVDWQPFVMLKSVAASLFMVAVLLGVSHMAPDVDSAAMVAGELILGIAVYVGGLLALGAVSRGELQFVRSCVWRWRRGGDV